MIKSASRSNLSFRGPAPLAAAILILCVWSPASCARFKVLRLGDPDASEPLDGLNAAVEAAMRRGGVPELSIALLKDGKPAFMQIYSLRGAPPMLSQAQVIGSLSKALTAAAALFLAEAGRFGLDDAVSTHLPWFESAEEPLMSKLTIRQLLNQTSGFSGGDDRLMLVVEPGSTLQSLARESAGLRLADRPGRRLSYSNWNYVLLGALIEQASGRDYGEFMDEFIFPALGMRSSAASPGAAADSALARGHQWWFGVAVPAVDKFRPDLAPAGFIVSTLPDMAAWLAANLGTGGLDRRVLLSEDGWRIMHSLPDGADEGYAMGWAVRRTEAGPLFFHEGMTSTSFAAAYFHPRSGYGLVALSPASGLYTPKEVSRLAERLMYRSLGLPEKRAAPIFALWKAAWAVGSALLAALVYLQYRGLVSWYRQRKANPPPQPARFAIGLLASAAADGVVPFFIFVIVPRGAGFPLWRAMLAWQGDLAVVILAFSSWMTALAAARLVFGLDLCLGYFRTTRRKDKS